MSNSDKITQDLLQSMSIIAQRAVDSAGYDKTIQATIVSCIDATIGKYKIRYQDGFWFAYTNDIGTSYSPGSNVYILVPGGDMSKDKTILGTTKRLGINYINLQDGDLGYTQTGSNLIEDIKEHELCSYQSQVVTLYDSNSSTLKIDTDAARSYIQSSSHLIVSALVRTALPLEQRYNGNYGLRFYLDFKDNATQDTVTRLYTLDVDTMEGNPYVLTNAVTQKALFEVDGVNFEKIRKIELFVSDFPKQQRGHSKDIFISNISFVGATALSEEEKNGVSLSLIAKKGYIFNSSSLPGEERAVEAQVRVKMMAIDNSSQTLPFYWFVENAKITPSHPYYNKYGGQGWKCLNTFNIISGTVDKPEVVDFNPGSYTFSVKKNQVKTQNTKYKCVVVYDGATFSKEFNIINDDFDYEIEINSDGGTQFAYDIGHPNLTCIVKNKGREEDPKNFDYVWSVVNNSGTFSSLSETTEVNTAYNNAVAAYNDFKTRLDNESIQKQGSYADGGTNAQHLEQLAKQVQSLGLNQRISANKIYCVSINQIVNFSTFKCSVFAKTTGDLIGSASITLVNKLNAQGMYTLVINNGSQVFNYSENGVSPTSQSLENPYGIPALSFTIYDNKGQPIDSNIANKCKIQWIVPNNNTMLSIPSSYNGYPNADSSKMIYENYSVFTYDILKKYYANRTENNIQLKVVYNELNLIAETDLTFVKQGDPGTNGTEYQVKIVPHVTSGAVPEYPIVTWTYGGQCVTNWRHYDGTGQGRWFDVELWHNGTKVYNKNTSGDTAQGKRVVIVWSVLKNKYTTSNSDDSCISINSSSGYITFNSASLNTSGYTPANIVRAAVTHEGLTYYATIPIITVKELDATANQFTAKLKKNTGFRYAVYKSDGTQPAYDNHTPFEIIVERKLSNGNYEDISLNENTDKTTYSYNYINRYYDIVDKKWISNDLFLIDDKSFGTVKKNQKPTKPKDGYDGQTVNNALTVTISISGTRQLFMHIPIHLMLNRYENSALNSWDGNSIELGDHGMILAPQVGAGIKDDGNTFTGVVIGKVKDSKESAGRDKSTDSVKRDEQIGLFGYSQGARSIFLDAKTGKAVFGKSGKGQIIMDPTSDRAILKSGIYTTEGDGAGMQIDLTQPEIKFGSGKFAVDSQGKMTAKGGGTIAGWSIGDTALTKDKVGISSNYDNNNSLAFWAGNTAAASAPFSVSFGGHLKASTATIGSGTKQINIGKSDDKNSAIYTGSKSSFDNTGQGFYLGVNGLSLGGNFTVNSSGLLTAKSGYIGNGTSGFTIKNNAIYNGRDTLSGTEAGVFLGTEGISLGGANEAGPVFKVTSGGAVTATSGTIAGWTISGKAIRRDGATNSYANSNGNAYSTGIYFGEGGLRLGANFHVDSSGNLYANNGVFNGSGTFSGTITANSGKIGNWEINSGALKNGNITIGSGGSISHSSNWSIKNDGTATFKNISITGGSIGGSTSMNGGSISTSGVSAGSSGNNLNTWADGRAQIVAKKVVADTVDAKFINTLFESSNILSVNLIAFKSTTSRLTDGNASAIIGYRDNIWYLYGKAASAGNADKLGNYEVSDFCLASTFNGHTHNYVPLPNTTSRGWTALKVDDKIVTNNAGNAVHVYAYW